MILGAGKFQTSKAVCQTGDPGESWFSIASSPKAAWRKNCFFPGGPQRRMCFHTDRRLASREISTTGTSGSSFNSPLPVRAYINRWTQKFPCFLVGRPGSSWRIGGSDGAGWGTAAMPGVHVSWSEAPAEFLYLSRPCQCGAWKGRVTFLGHQWRAPGDMTRPGRWIGHFWEPKQQANQRASSVFIQKYAGFPGKEEGRGKGKAILKGSLS